MAKSGIAAHQQAIYDGHSDVAGAALPFRQLATGSKVEKHTHHTRWPELEVLLDEMMDLPLNKREARLQALAKQDAELHESLQRLLLAMDEDDSFLERRASELSGDAPEKLLQAMRTQSGRLGPYRLLKCLGSGGMAEVWLAERDDEVLRQKVAIKILHPLVGATPRNDSAPSATFSVRCVTTVLPRSSTPALRRARRRIWYLNTLTAYRLQTIATSTT